MPTLYDHMGIMTDGAFTPFAVSEITTLPGTSKGGLSDVEDWEFVGPDGKARMDRPRVDVNRIFSEDILPFRVTVKDVYDVEI